MAKYYYGVKNKRFKIIIRLFLLGVIFSGALLIAYTFFPLISWQIYFAPAFASAKIDSPIPVQSMMNPSNITSLISNAANNVSSELVDADNWYPGFNKSEKSPADYNITIPKININEARVTNKDTDLSQHLVQFNSDVIPGEKGNSIIFGHSTLPQLYDENNYKTIFANAYKLNVGDEIILKNKNKTHIYKIENITVTDPNDSSVLAQNFSDSFLTIITCTPPGTIWKRLVIKARIEAN